MVRIKQVGQSLAAVSLLVGLSCLPVFAGSQAPLTDAIADYNNRDYSAAIGKLLRADQKNSLARYYLALSYQAVGNLAGAEKEYSWVYQNCKERDLKAKAWQGLQGLSAAKANRAVVAFGHDHQAGAAAKIERVSAPKARLVDVNGRPVSSDPSKWFQVEWHPGCPRH